jgi:hypothetical protein
VSSGSESVSVPAPALSERMYLLLTAILFLVGLSVLGRRLRVTRH